VDVTTALLRVQRQFGDEYEVIFNDDDFYGWVYEAEVDIIRTTGSNSVTIIVATSAFPSSVPDSVNIQRVSVNGKSLQHITKEEIDLIGISDTNTGTPGYWYRSNKQVCLYPQDLTSSQQVQITYNKVPVIMSGLTSANTFTVPQVYHDDVVKYCIARAHNKNHDMQAEKATMDLYDRNISLRRDESQSIDAPIYKINDPMDYDSSWSY
jgi:hypothetical protein